MPLPSTLSYGSDDFMFTECRFRVSLEFDYVEVMKKVKSARSSGRDGVAAGRVASDKVPILNGSGHISVYIKLGDTENIAIYFSSSWAGCCSIVFDAELSRGDGSILKRSHFSDVRYLEAAGGWGTGKFISHKAMKTFLSKSSKYKMTLTGSLSGPPSYCKLPEEGGAGNVTHPSVAQSQNYLGLFLGIRFANDGLTDVSINSGGKTFHAHRNVLCKRSDFFKACLMSAHDTMEQMKRQIEIVDFTAADVKAFLVELYNPMNAEFYELDCRTLIQVFKLVDKYLLHESTKLQYLSRIVAKLTKEHVVDALHATQTLNLSDDSDLVKKSFDLVKAIPKILWLEQKENWTQYANENLDRMRKLVELVIGERQTLGTEDKSMEELARVTLRLAGAGAFDDKHCGDTVQLRSNDGVLLYTLHRVLAASGMFCDHEVAKKTTGLGAEPQGETENPRSSPCEVAEAPEETSPLGQTSSGTEGKGITPDPGTETDPKYVENFDSHREEGTPSSGIEANSNDGETSKKREEEGEPDSGVETQLQGEKRSGSRLDELARDSGLNTEPHNKKNFGKKRDDWEPNSGTQSDLNAEKSSGNEAEGEKGPNCDKVCGALAAGFAEMDLPAHVLRRLLSCMYNLPAKGVMPTDLSAFKCVYDTLEAHGASLEVYEACWDQMLASMQVHPPGLAAWSAVQILEWANANQVLGLVSRYLVFRGGKIEAKDLDDPKLAQMHGWLLVEVAIACSSNEG